MSVQTPVYVLAGVVALLALLRNPLQLVVSLVIAA